MAITNRLRSELSRFLAGEREYSQRVMDALMRRINRQGKYSRGFISESIRLMVQGEAHPALLAATDLFEANYMKVHYGTVSYSEWHEQSLLWIRANRTLIGGLPDNVCIFELERESL